MVETNLTEPLSNRTIFDIFLIVYSFLNITSFLINFIYKVNPKLTIHILPYFVLLYQLTLLNLLTKLSILIIAKNDYLIEPSLNHNIFSEDRV